MTTTYVFQPVNPFLILVEYAFQCDNLGAANFCGGCLCFWDWADLVLFFNTTTSSQILSKDCFQETRLFPDRFKINLLTSVSDTLIWSFCLEDASRSASFPVSQCASDIQVSLPCLPLLLDNFLFAKLFLSRSPHLRCFLHFFFGHLAHCRAVCWQLSSSSCRLRLVD